MLENTTEIVQANKQPNEIKIYFYCSLKTLTSSHGVKNNIVNKTRLLIEEYGISKTGGYCRTYFSNEEMTVV